jgi:PIN domain nuclease of toxin-antitoxin system
MKYVLDACALLALLKNENGAEVVENLLVEAAGSGCSVSMNKYTLLEVYYGFFREDGEAFAEKQIKAIRESPINIVEILSDEVFRMAGRLKAKYKISLADAVVLGQGVTDNATIVSSDHQELDAVEKGEQIPFLWIR